MRLASGLLIATLLTTSIISGTFSKYTTSVSGQDNARAANWRFTQSSISMDNLFKSAYQNNGKNTVESADATDVIAPGTTGSASFDFTYNGSKDAPEAAYKFTVDTTGSTIAEDLKSNSNIQWQLDDDGTWGTWDDLMKNIKALSGDSSGIKEYAPNQLPDEFSMKGSNTHKISWRWNFETKTDGTVSKEQDVKDTVLGNKAELDKVKVQVTLKAEQID